MNDLILVTTACYVKDYTLEISFNNGVKAEIDFTKWIKTYPFFEQLQDKEYFKNFSIDGWTVVWENGADIAPEKLYQIALENQAQFV